MSLQHNKVFVSSRNQRITRFVPGQGQDQNILDANHPKELVDAVLVQEGWEMPRRVFQSFGSFNDQVWQQCISSLRNIDENRRSHMMYDDKSVLLELIERGIVDLSSSEDVAICSIIRYTAVVGEHLWSLLESQQVMIHKVERHFYRAMADNRVLTGRVLRLEDRLAELEREFTFPPRAELDDDEDPVIPELHDVQSTPVLRRSAWTGPFVNVPIASLEGKKRRQRERFQRAKEARASKHPVAPRVDVDSGNVEVDKCLSGAVTPPFPEQD
ncbi:hypothetical protein BDM02DRAFT_3194144 [Thelephora ganbajun]|uniref:Uncharacterized protein n=1 Tax=Thelephora ganbajun TaxID=370292 RepID=A0ACB6YWZ5_THEGA|nr:hypothetical protein BDM02DRAFT_3194144 [Thelephora ganbajun]